MLLRRPISPPRFRRPLPALAVFAAALAFGSAAALRSEPGAPSYDRDIRPILARRCYACHSRQAAVPQGGLLLDSPAGWRRGGSSGPAVVPGHPEKSLLIQAVRYEGTRKMPPAGKLPTAEIEALTRWVESGAATPGGAQAVQPATPSEQSQAAQPAPRQSTDWWSFQPVRRPAL